MGSSRVLAAKWTLGKKEEEIEVWNCEGKRNKGWRRRQKYGRGIENERGENRSVEIYLKGREEMKEKEIEVWKCERKKNRGRGGGSKSMREEQRMKKEIEM